MIFRNILIIWGDGFSSSIISPPKTTESELSFCSDTEMVLLSCSHIQTSYSSTCATAHTPHRTHTYKTHFGLTIHFSSFFNSSHGSTACCAVTGDPQPIVWLCQTIFSGIFTLRIKISSHLWQRSDTRIFAAKYISRRFVVRCHKLTVEHNDIVCQLSKLN